MIRRRALLLNGKKTVSEATSIQLTHHTFNPWWEHLKVSTDCQWLLMTHIPGLTIEDRSTDFAYPDGNAQRAEDLAGVIAPQTCACIVRVGKKVAGKLLYRLLKDKFLHPRILQLLGVPGSHRLGGRHL
jgi:hypothetical protein